MSCLSSICVLLPSQPAQGRQFRCQCNHQRAPSTLRQSDRQMDKRMQHHYDKATQTYWRPPNHAVSPNIHSTHNSTPGMCSLSTFVLQNRISKNWLNSLRSNFNIYEDIFKHRHSPVAVVHSTFTVQYVPKSVHLIQSAGFPLTFSLSLASRVWIVRCPLYGIQFIRLSVGLSLCLTLLMPTSHTELYWC